MSDKLHTKLSRVENEVCVIIKSYLEKNQTITTKIASNLINKSIATARKYLLKFVDLKLLKAYGTNKYRTYQL